MTVFTDLNINSKENSLCYHLFRDLAAVWNFQFMKYLIIAFIELIVQLPE
jgi:hypothetical protein